MKNWEKRFNEKFVEMDTWKGMPLKERFEGEPEELRQFITEEIETAFQEGFTQGCKKTGTYEQGRLEALKEIVPKRRSCPLCEYPHPECDCAGFNACRQVIIDKIKLQK